MRRVSFACRFAEGEVTEWVGKELRFSIFEAVCRFSLGGKDCLKGVSNNWELDLQWISESSEDTGPQEEVTSENESGLEKILCKEEVLGREEVLQISLSRKKVILQKLGKESNWLVQDVN